MSSVYFSQTSDRRNFTEKVLNIFSDQLGKAEKIFIKPNIVSFEPYPTTSHPEVLETLLKHLVDRQVIVGDAPAIDAGRSSKIIEGSVLKPVCDNYGAKLVNLYAEEMKTVKSQRGYKIKISALPLTCDFVISLPVLKIHNSCGLSGALKNQFGYLSKQDRLLMHSKIKNINKGIAEVNVAVPSNLFLVDAVESMVGAQECRHGGCPAKLGYMLAGVDPVALDYFGLQLLEHVEPKFEEKKQKCLPYMEYAEKYGVGTKNYTATKI